MGATEEQPLLATPEAPKTVPTSKATQQPTHFSMAVRDGPLDQKRAWSGKLLSCFGSFDHTGVSTAAFVKTCAPIAFGHNMKRAFNASFWKHALLFVLFFSLWGWLYLGASYNVGIACGSHPPKPHPGKDWDKPWKEWKDDKLESGLIRDPAEQVFLNGATWQPEDAASSQIVEISTNIPSTDDLDSLAELTEQAEQKAEEGGESVQEAFEQAKEQTESMAADQNKQLNLQVQQAKQQVAEGMASLNAQLGVGRKLLHKHDHEHEHEKKEKKHREEEEEDEDEDSKEKEHKAHKHDDHEHKKHTGKAHGPDAPACIAAQRSMLTVWGMLVLGSLAGAYYAARMRTAMRERFGIEGSRCKDCLTWSFCGPCALCQETRTLTDNNVTSGMWFGPTMLAVHSSQPHQAPVAQVAMKAPTKP